ncbi:MAG: hypothetical protein JHC98_02555 [Thermoleophilaceae bacterium]|nr:hypothetical protein [Thermoleophilaceae bacterium]
MNGKDLNKQLDALKRQATDLVRELHARKLAIPAGALLLAILAAVFLLPQSSSPPAAPPTATAPPVQSKVARVAQVSLIEPSSLDEDVPLANSEDPFIGKSGYKCSKVGSNPKTYDCIVSDLKVRIICTGETGSGPCAEGGGATAGGGASSGTGSGGDGGGATGGGDSGGGDSGGGDSGDSKSYYYVVTVSIDGTTKKNVVAGTELPKTSDALVVYAGTNDAKNKAVFISGDGVIVTGVKVDATFGSFSLKKGETATLTDANGAEHKLTLKSISKVTK